VLGLIACSPPPVHPISTAPWGSAPAGLYLPDGSGEGLSRIGWLPRLRPGVRQVMFSSYDRSGGLDDGFFGTHSCLRLRDVPGRSGSPGAGRRCVLAEGQGPGIIQRLFFTHALLYRDGLFVGAGRYLYVYLDGNQTPALIVELAELFGGRVPGFPAPLVQAVGGGFVSYVPIPFSEGFRVEIDADEARFFQINVTLLPTDARPALFEVPPGPRRRAALQRAVTLWSRPGDLAAEPLPGLVERRHELALGPGQRIEIELPSGPHVLRAVRLSPPEGDAPSGQLTLSWDDAPQPALDLPLALYFGRVNGAAPYASALVGQREAEHYNLLAAPYRRSARLSLRAEKDAPLQGTLRLQLQRLAEAPLQLGYLHGVHSISAPAQPWVAHPLLWRLSAGHYVGTVVSARGGTGLLPVWLEGDERFWVDGLLVAHGTGHEEYFNAGWYSTTGRLDAPFAGPMAGVPVFGDDGVAHRTTGYRWHLPDPIPYSVGIYAELEHGPIGWFPANYESAAFFYDVSP
jgi:hypothetical protein